MEDQPSEEGKGPRCPACGWTDVRRSQSRGFLDRLMTLVARVPYRCRSCGRRFYHAAEPGP
ncbi:MAG TPA: hypothetical protein VMT86_18225 [Bryobacteraceae bacterium]|nr:hypothetical protein [Bryobacteraceae bacterium]